jgi:hypothetical protein
MAKEQDSSNQPADGDQATPPSTEDHPVVSVEDYFDPGLVGEEHRAKNLRGVHFGTQRSAEAEQPAGQTDQDAAPPAR